MSEPVSLLDVFPTIAGLAGLSGPPGLEGEDLTPLMSDPNGTLGRTAVITHAFGSLSVRSEDWRLNFYNSGEIELFDVVADPMNFYDLSDDPAYASELAAMIAELRGAAADIGITVALAGEAVTGTGGGDLFSAATGATVSGSAGDDAYYATDAVTLIEDENGGWDKVFIASALDYALPDHIEELVLSFGWAKADVYSGNAAGNIISSDRSGHEMRGLAGNDQIIGNGGEDTLAGGSGADTLLGGDDDDEIIGGLGSDCIEGGAGQDVISGNNAGDMIDGGAGNDTISGGNAADTISGGDGADFLSGDGFKDLIYGGNDNDTLNGGGSADTLLGDGGSDMLFGNNAADSLSGGLGADCLNGGAGNDILHGGDGNDTLLGSTGNDNLHGGAGADMYRFNANHGALDRIHDFEDGVDVIAFSIAGVSDLGDLAITQAFAGADISYGTGMVRVLGSNATDFSVEDFVFF